MKLFRHILLLLSVTNFISCGNSGHEADAWGNFETTETIISAQTGGELLQMDAERGQLLEQGVTVAIIDTTQYHLNLRLLEARKQSLYNRLNEADANIRVLTAQKENLERELVRARRLLQDQAITEQAAEDLEGKIVVMKAQIDAARISRQTIFSELSGLDIQMEQARDQIDKCLVVNPIAGTVLEKYAENHELVMPGKPLYKIADLSEMQLKIYVSGGQLSQIKLGQKVQVLIDEADGQLRALDGTINWIASQAEFTPKTIQTREERVSQVYAVKITVPNDGSIKSGMPGEAIFTL
jgi:HlyD family secretion protein